MRLSYVIHLVPEELEKGSLVGEVEAVASGARAAISCPAALISFCQQDAAEKFPGNERRPDQTNDSDSNNANTRP